MTATATRDPLASPCRASNANASTGISAPTLATSTSVARNQKMAAASRAESSSRPASDRSPPIRLGFRGLAVAR
jgi:hypothetical protein